MKYTVVLPVIYWPTANECLATIEFPSENLLVVDNTQKNLGVSRSWNLGIDKMRADDTNWIIIVSTAIRFKQGGLDMIDILEQRPEQNVLESLNVYGWHLIAFNRRLIDIVGKFDENFYPAYFEDLDYSIRIQKTFRLDNSHPLWDKIPVDVEDMGMALSVKNKLIDAPSAPLIAYFQRKWGRHPGEWQKPEYDHPFNNENNSLDYWPLNNAVEVLRVYK